MITNAVICEQNACVNSTQKGAFMELYECMLEFEQNIVRIYTEDVELRQHFALLQAGSVETWMQPMVVGVDSATTRPIVALAGVH